MRLLREPALLTGLIAALVQLGLSLWTDWSTEQQGLANALVVALGGFAAAAMAGGERAAAALAGVVQSAIALALAFGFAIPPSTQVGVMALVSAVGAAWLRTQLVARVPDGPAIYEGGRRVA